MKLSSDELGGILDVLQSRGVKRARFSSDGSLVALELYPPPPELSFPRLEPSTLMGQEDPEPEQEPSLYNQTLEKWAARG